jgi:hypothetical protein
MKEIAKLPKYEVPTLQELYENKESVIKQSKLNVILNAEPKKEWVKIHPITKQPYMPIERQEYLMTMIFGGFNQEIKQVFLLANSVVTIVRIHAKNPITGIPEFQDGVGAVPIQLNKDSKSAIDFGLMKSNAIQIGAPASESYAFKDAVEKWGKIFGKDLGRKDNIQYIDRIHAMIATMEESQVSKELVDAINACTTEAQLKDLYSKNKGKGKHVDSLFAKHLDFINSVNETETTYENP